MSLWKHQRCSESKILYDWQAIELCVSLCELGGWFAAELCLCEHCVCLWAVLPIVLSGFRLTRCRAPLWLHLCNVCPSVTCVKCMLVAQVVEPRLQCRVLVVGWRAAELLLCVMWNVYLCALVLVWNSDCRALMDTCSAGWRAAELLFGYICAMWCVCLCACVLMCLCVIVRARAVCGTQTAVQLIGGYVQVGALQSSSAESGQSVGDQLVPTKPLQPFHPLQGELTATTCAGPFQELVLASTEGWLRKPQTPLFWGRKGVILRHMESWICHCKFALFWMMQTSFRLMNSTKL